MATAGAFVNGLEYTGANALTEARYVYSNLPYVLVVEGAIPVGTPAGSTAGEFCEIGELVPGDSNATMLNVTRKFASNVNCAAVLAVGTCSSFGGIPGAKGNVTNARGLLYQGTRANKGALNDPTLGTPISKPVINISGCPPHPDWIVGTIAHILDTLGTAVADYRAGDAQALVNALPPVTSYNRPVDYGYREYQCNSGPCPWRYNNTDARRKYDSGARGSGPTTPEPDWNRRYPLGDSRALGRMKWRSNDALAGDALGCLGILGCKGRKTKADCSKRRWNTDVAEEYGVNWCVGSRGNCHGCTEPTFPDKVGKFYTFA
jgi:hydrogenase small subunit